MQKVMDDKPPPSKKDIEAISSVVVAGK